MHSLLDILFPSECRACAANGSPWCRRCRASSATIGTRVAGLPVTVACDPPNPEWVRSLYAWKYRGERPYGRVCGGLLASAALEHRTTDRLVLVPIPTDAIRRSERGFDQAEELAKELARAWGIPVRMLLRRTKRTRRQVGLGRAERIANLEDAFVPLEPPPPDDLLLVDDVATTGATLLAARDVLARGGGRVVGAAVLFRRTHDEKSGAVRLR